MKKIITSLVSFSLLIICLIAFASCSRRADKVGNFELDSTTITLSWDRVIGARSYTVQISGQEYEKTSKQNKISLEHLDPGVYEIRVRANGDGIEYKDSDWAVYPFEREAEDGMKYKLINNKTEYQLVGLGSASGDIVMNDEYRGKPITSIADKAFAGNSKITSFTVGKYVKTIGDSAFSRCAELKSVSFKKDALIESFGKSCFQSCKKLESFAFPDTVIKVPNYIFSWCSELKSVTLGSNTTSIGEYAFSNCKNLGKIVAPDTLTLIDEYAFSDCETLKEADFGSSLDTISAYAFYNCVMLDTINIGESIKNINEYAFGNCKAITSFTIPDSCERIAHYAFRYCENLAEITLGASLEYIGYGVFFNTKIYNEATDNFIVGNWYISCKNRKATEVNMPKNVIAIADGAFQGCAEIVNIDFPTIKYICDNAFYGCEKLTYAMFDDALISIGAYAFKNCKALLRINLGDNLVSIGDYAFSSCSKLQDKNITLPDTVRTIGSGAFKGTKATVENAVMYIGKWAVGLDLGPGSSLSRIIIRNGTIGIANYAFNKAELLQVDTGTFGIDIADTVEYIGRGAFYKAAASGYIVTVKLPKNLKIIGDYAFYGNYCAYFNGADKRELVIPEGTELIGRSAFYGCEGIYSLSIPGTVKEISPYAFYGCVHIGDTFEPMEEKAEPVKGYFTLGDGIEIIGDKAFQSCIAIQSIIIPDSVKSIGVRSFYKCEGLKELVIGSGLTSIPDYAFYNCASLEALVIPNGITSIGKYAFRGCTSLQTLVLSDNLISVGNFAFFGAEHVHNVIIPSSVKSIGMHAFRGFTRAKSIILPATVETVDAHAFYGAPDAVIYVIGGNVSDKWNGRWNSSYATVISGATLSEDKTYVISFVKNSENLDNMPYEGTIAAPVRDGYEFVGFSDQPNTDTAKYTLETLNKVSENTVLYTVWKEIATTQNN